MCISPFEILHDGRGWLGDVGDVMCEVIVGGKVSVLELF